MSYDIHITRATERDLNSAADYIEFVLLNPQTADDLLDEAEKKIGELSTFPEKFALVDDPVLKAWGIRFTLVKNYIAFYVIFFIVLYYLEDLQIDPEYMRMELSKTLPYYMLPSYYVKIDEIPLLPNGKINKKALAAPDRNSYRAAYAAPESPEQEKICEVFGRILEMDHIGIDDDFYDLGGDSIRSMQAAQALEELGVNVSLLYKHRTARMLSCVLSEMDPDGKTDAERNAKALEHDQPLGYFHLYMFDYQLYAPGSIMWNMPRCWKFSKNDVDPDRLAAAFEKVLNAHPVFRTLLRYDENYELVQHYEETLPVKVDIEQVLGTLDADTLLQYVQPFRLLGEPMYRAKLLETDESICLFLDMHHIICDGVSMQVLANDLTKAYEGREPETDYYFLSLRDQYKNVISDDYIRAKEYFENQYGGKEWVYGLTPEKESRKSAFDRVVMPLGISEEDLAAYLSSAGISRNAFLQTVALLTIARMENAKNVMLGWVYSGRDEQKKQSAVGLLIREIPLGLSLDELTDIRSLYESVKKQMSQGLVNRDYPYLTANASVAVNDVFCFIDEGDILDLRVFGDIPCEEIPLAATNALGWMMALTFFNGDGIFMCMNYTSVRYNRETMERYCEIYQQIAAKLMKSRPETAVNEILG